ncbi:hypothetical protein [Rhizobium phaseoli]|uniref:hypothetical protein n=1 Tax=Rhizobium phaseoli TaxID=396 RepID=UPI003D7C314D
MVSEILKNPEIRRSPTSAGALGIAGILVLIALNLEFDEWDRIAAGQIDLGLFEFSGWELEIVSKNDLMKRVWPRVVENNTIQVHISAIRKAPGRAPPAENHLGPRLSYSRKLDLP